MFVVGVRWTERSEGEVAPVEFMKAYRGSRIAAPVILNLDT